MTTEPLQRFWVFGIDDLHDAMVTIDHLSGRQTCNIGSASCFHLGNGKG